VFPDDLAEEYHALAIDQESRRVSCFVIGIPTETVQIGERVAGIQDQIEIVGEPLIHQEFIRPGAEILWRTGINHHDPRAGIGESLRLLDEILNLAVTKWALVAGISSQHYQHDRALGRKLGQVNAVACGSR
jgi:hypothetical protein